MLDFGGSCCTPSDINMFLYLMFLCIGSSLKFTSRDHYKMRIFCGNHSLLMQLITTKWLYPSLFLSNHFLVPN